MIILGELVEKKVTKLKPTAFKFLSMVKEPAYQISLDKVKNIAGLVEREEKSNMLVKTKTKAKNNIVPKEVRFEKSIYSDAKSCEAIMSDKGYSEFEMSETDEHFIAKSKFADDKFKGEASEIILADFDKGVSAIVDTLLPEGEAEKAKSEDGGETGAEGETTEEVTETTEETKEPETTEGEAGEAETTEEEVDTNVSVKEELGLDTNIEQSKESTKALDIQGASTVEVVKAYGEILETGSKDCKKYAEWAAYYTENGSFPEALEAGSFDGSVPGMDEVFEVLKAFIASAFSMQDKEAAKSAFTEAADYMVGLKDLFDKYAMSDLAKALLFKPSSNKEVEDTEEKSKSTTVVSEEPGKEKDILDAVKELLVTEITKSRDKANDIFKDQLETVNSNLVKTAEYIKTKVGTSNEKVEEFAKKLNELAGMEPEREVNEIVEKEEDDFIDRKLGLQKGFNLRNAVSD